MENYEHENQKAQRIVWPQKVQNPGDHLVSLGLCPSCLDLAFSVGFILRPPAVVLISPVSPHFAHATWGRKVHTCFPASSKCPFADCKA